MDVDYSRLATSNRYTEITGIKLSANPNRLVTKSSLGYSTSNRILTESELVFSESPTRYIIGEKCPVMPLQWYKLPNTVKFNPLLTNTDVQWFFSPPSNELVKSGNINIRLSFLPLSNVVRIDWAGYSYPFEIRNRNKRVTITDDQLRDFHLLVTSKSNKGTIISTELSYQTHDANRWIGNVIKSSITWTSDPEVTITNEPGPLILTDSVNNKFTIISVNPVLWSLDFSIIKYRDIRLRFDLNTLASGPLNKLYCSNNLIL